jgi:hypothetical protein
MYEPNSILIAEKKKKKKKKIIRRRRRRLYEPADQKAKSAIPNGFSTNGKKHALTCLETI